MTENNNFDCDECQEQLVEFALDELSPAECARVQRHLESGCAACNEALATIAADLAVVAQLAPQMDAPTGLEQRVMAGLVKLQRPAAADNRIPTTRKQRARPVTVAALVLAASLAGVAAWFGWQRHAQQQATFNDTLRGWAELQQRVERIGPTVDLSKVPPLEFTLVRGPATSGPVHGFTVLDPIAKQFHVYVFELPELSADWVYTVWLVGEGDEFVSVASARLDSAGAIACVVDVPASMTTVVGIAVSEEANRDAVQPSDERLYQALLPR